MKHKIISLIKFVLNLLKQCNIETINLSSKIDFIKSAINDSQSTIRSIDIKTEILLAILILIMTGIFTCFKYEFNWYICILIIFWAISVILSLNTLHPFNNPTKYIRNNKLKGLFYGLSYFNKDDIDNDKLLQDMYNLSQKDLLKELVFDFSKLIYIRQKKIENFKITIFFTVITIALFAIILILNIMSFQIHKYDNQKNIQQFCYKINGRDLSLSPMLLQQPIICDAAETQVQVKVNNVNTKPNGENNKFRDGKIQDNHSTSKK